MTGRNGFNTHPRILLVEDDAAMRALLMDELTEAGYLVSQAVDGAEGAQKLSQAASTGGFNLIITDLKMPRVSGRGLLAIVKERYPTVPVIAITAYADEPEVVKSYHTDFFAYLRKPFKMEELKTAVEAALRNRVN
ncbi:MAG TPA: response regulator [Nitrospiria bacterium]|nr:response regulator [Nitrospiria bacterium]